jgi:hypothetical protein
MRFTGIRRKGASDGTQSWQEVVQNAPRTSNPGQWAQRKKPSRTTVDMGNAFVVYYESRKRELKIWVMNESRCDTWGCAGGNGERGNSLSFNEQRQRGMLPRASVHAEDVNSIEELNRQRVQAGQIASIFLVRTSSCHVFGLSFCILISWSENGHLQRAQHPVQNETVLWRTWFQIPTTLKVSLWQTRIRKVQRLIRPAVLQDNLFHHFLHRDDNVHHFLHRDDVITACTCVGNAVLTLSVFLTVSHLLLSLSLSGLVYHVSFYKYIIF